MAAALFLTRAEILAVSPVSVADRLDRAAADAAIRATIRVRGGVKACVAALAQEYGDRPETASARMTWARQTVAALYRGPANHTLSIRTAA